MAVLNRALMRVAADTGLLPLPVQPATPVPGRGAFRPASAVRAFQAAMLAIVVGGAVLGGLSIARELVGVDAASTAATAVPTVVANGGVAVGLAGDVFIADPLQGTIRRLRPRPPLNASWTAQDIGTDGYPLLGNTVPFDAASDIAVAPGGDVYIADARNNRICRIVRSTGEVVTIAGSGAPRFDGDGGPAVGASLHGPSAVAVAPNGDVYIADTLNNRIRMIAHQTGIMSTVVGDAAGLSRPMGLVLARTGDLYVADTGHQRVLRINGTTGSITTVATGLGTPMGLALVPKGDQVALHVADALNNSVYVIEPDGRMTTLSGLEPLVAPTRLAYHPGGWLYVKDGSPDGVTALAVRGAEGP